MNSKRTPDKFPEEIMNKYVGLNPDSKKRILEDMFAKLDEKKTKPSSGIAFSRRLWYFALAASVIITVSLFFIFPLSNPSTAKVVGCWNYCRISRADGKIGKITKDTELAVGDMLITGPDAGISIKTADDSFVSVGRNSQLEYTAPRGGKMCTFSLHRGSILAKVSPDKAKLFSVKTPSALLKVIGTKFEAKVFGDSNKKMEKNKMKRKNKTAALTVLTVLTGAVAVNPVSATETMVESGSIANISSGTVKVSPVKARKFMDSVINANYRKSSHIWLSPISQNGLLRSLYRFDPASGNAEKVADFIGRARPTIQTSSGTLISLGSVLIGSLDSISANSGNAILGQQLMIVTSKGDLLDLTDIAKYSPWYPALSPDGTKLAFLGHENKAGKIISGLYVLDFGTMSIKKFYDGAFKTTPAWSPDSSEIFISKGEGYTTRHQIVSINVNSGKVFDTGYKGCGVAFSPDGKQLAYSGAFTKGGRWIEGIPVSGNIFVVSYPGGKPEKLSFEEKGGAVKPVFSPNGKQLAYLNGINNELHIIDLDTKNDRKICSGKGNLKWTDNKKLIIFSGLSIKEVDLSSDPAKVKDIKPDFPEDADYDAIVAALKPVFKLYLAGLKASCANKLSDAGSNYRKAYKELLKFKDSAQDIDPALKLESLTPYLAKFKEMAEMPERDLYMEQLRYRMTLFPYMLNYYVRKNKQLPESMDKLANFTSEHGGSYDYIRAKTPEAKILFLMPDQEPGSPSEFELKVLDDNNIEFYSAPTRWGERFKIHAFRKRGYWQSNRKVEPVKNP